MNIKRKKKERERGYQNHACIRKKKKKKKASVLPPCLLSRSLQMFSFWRCSASLGDPSPHTDFVFNFLWLPVLACWLPCNSHHIPVGMASTWRLLLCTGIWELPLSWPWQPPLSLVYLEKGGRAEVPTEKHLCWCPFLHIHLESFSSSYAGC